MKARVIYKEVNNQEGFAIELLNGDDWELYAWYPCAERKNANPGEGFDYLHWTVLKRLGELQDLGYEIIFS